MIRASLCASLPLIVFVLLVFTARARQRDLREAVLHAAVAWGVLVVVVTEGLGAAGALSRIGLVCTWGLLSVASSVACRRFTRPGLAGSLVRENTKSDVGFSETELVTGAILVIWGLVGMTAIAAPPNTIDAMQYHMPRIVHWLHNHSLAFYPANEIRELNMPPWAEYAMLQFHGLTGGDWLDNLIQWASMGLCALTVSLIARELGATRAGQALAALVSATIPEGILQASGAKNDYVVAFWICATAYFLVTFGKKPVLGTAIPLGLAAGLAFLTKGTAEIFIAGLGVMLVNWPRKMLAQSLRFAALAAVLAFAINAPHFARNVELFGSPFGPPAYGDAGQFKLSNNAFTPSIVASNVLRNFASQIETPSTALNKAIESSITAILSVMGEDVNDPRATWDFTMFHVTEMNRHEALAGNPLQLGLFLLATFILAFSWFRTNHHRAGTFALAVIAGFILFSAYLKWQPWHTRLLLPCFVLSAAVTGTVLARVLPALIAGAVAIALPIFAGPALLENAIRPLTYAGAANVFNASRVDQLFAEIPFVRDSFRQAARFIKAQPCTDIGVDTRSGGDFSGYEYPLLVLLGDIDGTKKIREVEISSVAKRYVSSHDPKPCMIVCMVCGAVPFRAATYLSQGWNSTTFSSLAVFTRGPIVQPPPAPSIPDAGPVTAPPHFAQPGDNVVFGDWNGDGKVKIGVFRNGRWILNLGHDALGIVDKTIDGRFGFAGDIPVVGDWDGKGKTKVGVYHKGLWILDLSGLAQFNKRTVRQIHVGLPDDTPVVGDWNGDGRSKVGIFRKGMWIIDYSGSGASDAASLRTGNFGLPGDVPVVGHWDGKRKDEVGVFRGGEWVLDLSGTASWDPAKVIVGHFGMPGDKPIVGDWDGSGKSKIGVLRDGCWHVDLSATALWKPSTSADGCTDVPGPAPRIE